MGGEWSMNVERISRYNDMNGRKKSMSITCREGQTVHM